VIFLEDSMPDTERSFDATLPPLAPTVISALPLETAIRELLDRDAREPLREFLAEQPAPDVADVLDRFSTEERVAVFTLLAPRLAAAVLSEVGTETATELLDALTPDDAAALLENLPPDDAAAVLGEEETEETTALLERMSPEAAEEVRALLEYPENSAGRLMTERFVRVPPEMAAGDVVDHLRRVDPHVETFSDLYVVEGEDRLVGVVSLRQVLLANPATRLGEFMTTKVISVAPGDDREVAASLVAHYDFMAIPVVDDGRILGIVTVDDIVDVLLEEGTEDQLRFGAVEPGVWNQPYFTTPIHRVVRSRVGWLLLLFVAETFTGVVLRSFEDELARVVALSFFIPLLIGTGGNTGAQTVSTIIRGLALKEIRLRDTWRVIVREAFSGIMLGLLLGTAGYLRAMLWGSGHELSLVVGLTVVAICTWANTIGALIPLVASRVKIDPALVSAPLITTLVDASGLFIYLTIAKLLLSALS
jgi:magnesium transporter